MIHKIDFSGVFMSMEEWLHGSNYFINPINIDALNYELWLIDLNSEKGDTIEINIDSIGGSYAEGWKIRNRLNDLKDDYKIVMVANGDVGSVASLVYMTASKENRLVRKGSMGYIHNPIVAINGNADEHIKVADILREVENEMAKQYSIDMGITEEEARKYMDNETFFSPTQMIDSGFAGGFYPEKEDEKIRDLVSALYEKSCINGKCKL